MTKGADLKKNEVVTYEGAQWTNDFLDHKQ